MAREPVRPVKWKRTDLTEQLPDDNQGFPPEYGPHSVDRLKDAKPIDVFFSIWTDEMLERICKKGKRYAQQKGNHSFHLHKESLLKALGILILSGYVQLPQRRMFWERSADANNVAVTANMPRERFLEILRYIHFNNNLELDKDDRLYKIRPLIDHLNGKFKELAKPLAESLSVDEAMEPYYGHHPSKQFIRGKPVRFGYKVL